MPRPAQPLYYYWLFLLASIVLEVVGTCVMKISQDSWPILGLCIMYAFLAVSYFCMAKAVVKVPIGVAYAFWEGLGLLLITLASVLILHEYLNATRICALCMVLIGTLLVHHGTEEGPAAASREETSSGGDRG